jgi:hypothetical protein
VERPAVEEQPEAERQAVERPEAEQEAQRAELLRALPEAAASPVCSAQAVPIAVVRR